MQRLKVLYLSHHLPWPTDSGGRLREAELIRRLSDRFEIRVVAISKDLAKDRSGLAQAGALGVEATIFAARHQCCPAGPLRQRHGSRAARRFLRRLAEWCDVVHVEGHYLLPLLPPRLRARAVLVEHNIESDLFRQRAALAGRPGQRWPAQVRAALTRRDERQAWRTARLVVGVSAEDVRVIEPVAGPNRVRLVPNGADHLVANPNYLVPRGADRLVRTGSGGVAPGTAVTPSVNLLVFVGNFAYPPNQDAARELIGRILPQVQAGVPAARLALVGSGPPDWLTALTRDSVTVTGPVADVGPWIEAAGVIVAPLRIGGGAKIKILEALALGKAVVTTNVGAQGLARLPAGSFVCVEGPDRFARAVIRLLTVPSERRRQELRARVAARLLPTWASAADQLAACWAQP